MYVDAAKHITAVKPNPIANSTVRMGPNTYAKAGDSKVTLLGWHVDKSNAVEPSLAAGMDQWTLSQRYGGSIAEVAKATKRTDSNVLHAVRFVFTGTQFEVCVDDLVLPLMSLIPKKAVPSGRIGFSSKSTTESFGYVRANRGGSVISPESRGSVVGLQETWTNRHGRRPGMLRTTADIGPARGRQPSRTGRVALPAAGTNISREMPDQLRHVSKESRMRPGALHTTRGTRSASVSQRGVSLVELLLALVVFTLLLGASAAYSINWMNQEKMRSAVYQVQTFLQRARLEAVSRNRSCRFTVNTATRSLQVIDMNNTSTTTDDVVLVSATIDPTVNFALPTSGSPVTLNVLSGTQYETSFESTGIVSSGIGFVSLSGGQTYRKVLVYGAGGVQVQKWDGSAWATGA